MFVLLFEGVGLVLSTRPNPQINPQTSDDFSIVSLAVSLAGLMISGMGIVLLKKHRKATE